MTDDYEEMIERLELAPDYYGRMLERELDDDIPADGEHGVRAANLEYLKRRMDADGRYWKHDGPLKADGVWVSNEGDWRDKTRKSARIDKPDPELKYAYSFGWRMGKVFGGLRPSKRKFVK